MITSVKAGMQIGDRMVAVNSKTLRGFQTLQQIVDKASREVEEWYHPPAKANEQALYKSIAEKPGVTVYDLKKENPAEWKRWREKMLPTWDLIAKDYGDLGKQFIEICRRYQK